MGWGGSWTCRDRAGIRDRASCRPAGSCVCSSICTRRSFWQWAFVFASLVVHEGSHAMAAAGFGHEVARISITPIGAVASLEGEIHSRPEAEAAVAMAGPMTSLILAALGYLLLLYGNADRDKVEFFVGANIALAIFNLIPAFPLDGGRSSEPLWLRSWALLPPRIRRLPCRVLLGLR